MDSFQCNQSTEMDRFSHASPYQFHLIQLHILDQKKRRVLAILITLALAVDFGHLGPLIGKLDNFGFGHGNHRRSCAHLRKNEPYQGILDSASTLDILKVFECLQHIWVFWLVADLVPSWLSTGQILCKVASYGLVYNSQRNIQPNGTD